MHKCRSVCSISRSIIKDLGELEIDENEMNSCQEVIVSPYSSDEASPLFFYCSVYYNIMPLDARRTMATLDNL